MAPVQNNTSLAQNANWVEKTSLLSSDKTHSTNGLAVLGSQESLIQAGNALTVSAGGQVVNTDNMLGKQVDISGAGLLMATPAWTSRRRRRRC